MQHKDIGNVSHICGQCNGCGFIMTDTHSVPCECDRVGVVDVYEDKGVPYRVYWVLLNMDGEIESKEIISIEPYYDIEHAISIGLAWKRSDHFIKDAKL